MKLLGLRLGRGKVDAAAPTPADDHLRDAAFLFASADYDAAIALWLPLAQAGNAVAQNSIGMCLIGGLGAEPDPAAGAKWLLAAAAQGHAEAQRNLADAYMKGEGVPPSDVDAEL